MNDAPTDAWFDAQTPVGDQVFLDHTAHFVDGLDAAGRALERLGFRPSGVNLQRNLGPDGVLRPSGTSNRLVRLRRGFLEFLAATHEAPLADQLRAGLARYRGLHLIALSRFDLAAERIRLVEAGFSMQPLLEMRREADEHGVSGEVRWSILRTEPGVMPEGRIQYVYPHTPDLTWPPGSTEHPNAADSLTGVLVVVADAAEARQRYAAFAGRPAAQGRLQCDRGVVRIVAAAEAARIVPGFSPPDLPYIAAVSIGSADLSATRAALSKGGVSAREAAGRIWTAPADGLGAHICFHEGVAAPF